MGSGQTATKGKDTRCCHKPRQISTGGNHVREARTSLLCTSASDPGSRPRLAAVQLLLRATTDPCSSRSLQLPPAETKSVPSRKDLFFRCFFGALYGGYGKGKEGLGPAGASRRLVIAKRTEESAPLCRGPCKSPRQQPAPCWRRSSHRYGCSSGNVSKLPLPLPPM